MKTTKKRIWKIISTVVTVLIFLLIAWMVACRVMNKPMFIFGRSAVWIVSPSMEDEIPMNSYILIEKITADDIRVGEKDGDVVMFKSDDPALKGGYNTHRIIGVDESTGDFISKGDNNAIRDNYTVKRENVVARYIRTLPVMSAIMRFFLTPAGLVATLVILVIIAAAFFLPDLLKKSKPASKDLTDEERERLIAEELEKLKSQSGAKKEDDK